MLLLRDDGCYFHSDFTGEIKSLGKSDISGTRKYLAGRHHGEGQWKKRQQQFKNYYTGQEKAHYMTMSMSQNISINTIKVTGRKSI